MSIAGIFALGGGGYGNGGYGNGDSASNYPFGGYYGTRGRGRFGTFNGYNDGFDNCCDDRDSSQSGLLGSLDD